MFEKTILQRAIEQAEERRADAAFLRSMGIAPIEEGAESSEQDASPEAEMVSQADAAPRLGLADFLFQAGITPEDMITILRAAHDAFVGGRVKAELQRLGISASQELAKEEK